MDLMRTSRNYKVVTSDEFLDLLISKGCVFAWYFHYMPVGQNADTSLLLTPDQRTYMKDRVRELRGVTGGKELYCIDFQNDGEFAGGCVAGGRIYCHINAAGDVEPCVFIHYSSANIRDKSFWSACSSRCSSSIAGAAVQRKPPAPVSDARKPGASAQNGGESGAQTCAGKRGAPVRRRRGLAAHGRVSGRRTIRNGCNSYRPDEKPPLPESAAGA